MWKRDTSSDEVDSESQVIRAIGAEGLDRRGPVGSCRLFLGPGFRLGARWNRLVETVKTRKKREKTGKKWARYGLKRVNKERTGGINWNCADSNGLASSIDSSPAMTESNLIVVAPFGHGVITTCT